MKEAYYFSHDSNARHDPKITAMRGVYGSEGYGWYWMLVEMMRESDGYKLDMQSKYIWNAYAMQMHSTSEQMQSFVSDCINEFNLFHTDGQYFWSESLIKRMGKKDEISNKRKQAAQKRWEKQQEDANAMQMHEGVDANASKIDALKEKKVKESKVNEMKKKYADFVAMSPTEYQALIEKLGERKTIDMIEALNLWKGSKGKKTKSDYLTVLNWVRKEQKEEKPTTKPSSIAQQYANSTEEYRKKYGY